MKKIKNIERPFDEIFCILKGSSDFCSHLLEHSADKLLLMNQHIENATDILLQGLQSMGQVIGSVGAFDLMNEMRNMGFFISGLTNLIETLNVMREDVRYILIQRGLMV